MWSTENNASSSWNKGINVYLFCFALCNLMQQINIGFHTTILIPSLIRFHNLQSGLLERAGGRVSLYRCLGKPLQVEMDHESSKDQRPYGIAFSRIRCQPEGMTIFQTSALLLHINKKRLKYFYTMMISWT